MAEATLPETLPFRVLLDEAMGWVRRSLRTFFWKFGLALAVLSCLYSLLNLVLMRWILDSTSEGFDATLDVLGCSFAPTMLILGLSQLVIFTSMGAVTLDAVGGREAHLGRRVTWALRPRALGTVLLAGLAAAASYLCCLVPALFVIPLLSFTIPAMVEEGRFGLDALGRSATLTRHNPGGQLLTYPLVKALVLLLVGFLLSMAVSMVVQMPLGLAQQWVIFRSPTPAEVAAFPPLLVWLQVLSSFAGGFVSALVALWTSYGLALLYRDTLRRTAGLDLEAAIDEIDRQRGGGDPLGGSMSSPEDTG